MRRRCFRRGRAGTLALLALGMTAGGLHGQPAPDEARRTMAALLDSVARAGFSGHVLAVRGGSVVFEESRGLADPASGTPIDSATIFSIGSVTKQFTRAAILRLEEQGRLSTSDPVSRFIPDLPEDKRAITLDHLLGMQAGLHAYHDDPDAPDPGDHQRMDKARALQRIGAQRLLFAPGTGREYSNSGYTLLAAVVEAVTGRPFADYVRTELVEPAGMTSTGFYGDQRWADGRVARGRGPRTFGTANAPHRWPAPSWVLMGAGGMVSNARDLARWIAAVRGGKILGPAALAKFYPRDPALYAGGNDFGFGTLVLEFGNGADLIIVTTNTGAPRMSVGVALAEALRGQPVPDEMRRMFAGRQETPGPGPQAQGGQGQGQGGEERRGSLPDTPETRTLRAFMAALRDGSPAALRKLVEEQFTAGMRDAFPMEQHLEVLSQLSAELQNASTVQVAPRAAGEFEIRLGGSERQTVVLLTIEGAPPHRIARVAAEDG